MPVWIQHVGTNLHLGLDATVNGFDCPDWCQKRPEVEAFMTWYEHHEGF